MSVIIKGKYTPTPNVFLNVIPTLDLSCVAKDILWAIIRMTYGFHKGWVILKAKEIARVTGCNQEVARRWVSRLIRWGVLIRAKCSVKTTKRKYKPRFVYAINPNVSKWAVFRRKRFYKQERNESILEETVWELGDKYNELFHSPPNTEIYKQLKELVRWHSPKRIIGMMKRAVRCGESWNEMLERLLPQTGGTD